MSRLRRALDEAIAGQHEAKLGLLLAWLAREHALLVGPPGCGKSRLAVALMRAAGGESRAVGLHRDSTSEELLGPMQIKWVRTPGGRGLRLRRRTLPGELRPAELLLLDDLGRAPRETFHALLRVLDARDRPGPPRQLTTAIATLHPLGLVSHADPLEPAQLDRFAVQLRLRGLIADQCWGDARRILDGDSRVPQAPVLEARERARLRDAVPRVRFAAPQRRLLVRVLEALRRHAGGEELTTLTDRSFARAAPRILRAHALLNGRGRVEARDLHALRYMVACRLPPELSDRLEELIDHAIETAVPCLEARAARLRGGQAALAAPLTVRASRPLPPADGALPEARAGDRAQRGDVDLVAVLRLLDGATGAGGGRSEEDPGGAPRRYRPPRPGDEPLDGDPVDLLLHLDGLLPGGPRSFVRERRRSGGDLVLLRDVSASMEGRIGLHAGRVVRELVRAAARREMRIGYIEFNDRALRFHGGGHFLHRAHAQVLEQARRARPRGRTSYAAPLSCALAELRRARSRRGQVLLLTDGVPVLGDPAARRERALAARMGVCIHTVFLGLGAPPAVLAEIARETGGRAFWARPTVGGGLDVCATG